MIYNILIASIALSSVVVVGRHGGSRHHHGPPLPPFLSNVTEEGRRAFFIIVENDNLTGIETDSQIATWAQTYGVTDAYNAFEANVTARVAQVKQNSTAVINNLVSVQSQLDAIISNKNITRRAQGEAIDVLGNQYPQEVDTLFFIDETSAIELEEGEIESERNQKRGH